MRNFEECKAEIFRRSEKRIVERKNNRILTLICCLPLFICVAMFSLMILPAMMPANSAGRSPEAEHDAHPLLSSVVMAEVLKDDFDRTYTDDETVREIIEIISGITAVREGFDNDTEAPNQNTALPQDEGYTVVLTDEAGNEQVYVLIGYTLIEQLTDAEYHITAYELAELQKALGIPVG